MVVLLLLSSVSCGQTQRCQQGISVGVGVKAGIWTGPWTGAMNWNNYVNSRLIFSGKSGLDGVRYSHGVYAVFSPGCLRMTGLYP